MKIVLALVLWMVGTALAKKDSQQAAAFRQALSQFDTQLVQYQQADFQALKDAVTLFQGLIQQAAKKRGKPSAVEARLLQFGATMLQASKPVPVGTLQEYRRLLMELTGNPPLPVMQPVFDLGRQVYHKHCYACHGRSGKGDGPLAARIQASMRDLSDAKTLQHTSVAMHYNWLLAGKAKMPSYREVLDAKEFWSVLFYLQTLPYAEDQTTAGGERVKLYDLVYRSNDELQKMFGSLPTLRKQVAFQQAEKR